MTLALEISSYLKREKLNLCGKIALQVIIVFWTFAVIQLQT